METADEMLQRLLKRAACIVRMRDTAKAMENRKMGRLMNDKYALIAVQFVEDLARLSVDGENSGRRDGG